MSLILTGSDSSAITTSKQFERLLDRHFTCEIPLQSLAVRPETVLSLVQALAISLMIARPSTSSKATKTHAIDSLV